MDDVLVEVDGAVPTTPALHHRALANYGHFTALQVRDASARGLDLHLDRLRAASRELFGREPDAERIRQLLRQALAGTRSASVRIHVHEDPGGDELSVMVTVRPPAEMPEHPQRLQTVRYTRPVAHIKHVGTFAQIYYGRTAEQGGFDDALLTGPDGALYETTTANVGFVDDDTVVWPDGPVLTGITQRLIDRHAHDVGLATVERPVPPAELPSFRAAFIANSLGVAPVGAVDDLELATDPAVLERVRRAYAAEPWVAV